MLDWLNLHVGTDWATYQGWILSIAGIGVSFYGLYRAATILKQKTKKAKIKQIVKKIDGISNQAGRDINNTTNNHYTGIDENDVLLKKKHVHDLKIIEEILILLPYEETIDQVERSYIVGMFYKFARNLEDAEKFTDEKYRLYNATVETSKAIFIDSLKAFNNSFNGFLSVDQPDRKPLRLDLPYDWKNKGDKSESIYRTYQNNMRETSGVMIECYKDFIRTFKQNDFITDKL